MFPAHLSIAPQPINLETKNPIENVLFFKKQWENYCELTGINNSSSEIKNSVFKLIIGQHANKIIENCISPSNRKHPDEILNELEKYYTPSTNFVLQRYNFNCITQNPAESIESYANRIKEAAFKCNFEEQTLIELMRDRFICGLLDNGLKQFLITKPLLTFKQAIDYAKEKEPVADISIILRTKFEPVKIKEEKLDHPGNSMVNGQPIDERLLIPLPIIEPKQEPVMPPPIIERNEGESAVSTSSTSINNTIQSQFEIGSYLVAKKDKHKNPAERSVWRIDSNSLLQKFNPTKEKGVFKSTDVYSGWSSSTINLYEKIETSGTFNHKIANQKELTVKIPIVDSPVPSKKSKRKATARS